MNHHLEHVINENNKKIAEQHDKLSDLSKDAEQEKLRELEKMQREKENQKRREDQARLMELQQKVEEENVKSVILNKNKVRPSVTFSFFG